MQSIAKICRNGNRVDHFYNFSYNLRSEYDAVKSFSECVLGFLVFGINAVIRMFTLRLLKQLE